MAGVVGGGTPASGILTLSRTSIPLQVYAGQGITAFPQDAFTLTNTGTGAWSNPQIATQLSSGSGWFSLATTANADGSFTYTPSIDATSLTADTYSVTLTVTDTNVSNTGQVVTISLNVVASVPTLLLSPTGISFSYPAEAAGTTKTIRITNAGQGTLATPTVSNIAYSGSFTGWLASGTSITSNGDGTYDLAVTPSNLGTSAGTAQAIVTVASSGASNTPQTFTVDVALTTSVQALLVINRSIDDAVGTVGGANPATETQALTTGNAVALAGPTITASSYSGAASGWATASITGGNTYRVVYDISGIGSAGVSYFDATIADANASNTVSHRTVLVMGGAAVPDQIIASPNVLTKNAATTDTGVRDFVTITNLSSNGLAGLGTITAAMSPSVTWATASYANGTVTVNYDPSVVASGTTVTGTLVITASAASNSPLSISVQLNTQAATTDGYYPPYHTLPQTDDSGGTDGAWDSGTNNVTYVPFAQPSLGGYA